MQWRICVFFNRNAHQCQLDRPETTVRALPKAARVSSIDAPNRRVPIAVFTFTDHLPSASLPSVFPVYRRDLISRERESSLSTTTSVLLRVLRGQFRRAMHTPKDETSYIPPLPTPVDRSALGWNQACLSSYINYALNTRARARTSHVKSDIYTGRARARGEARRAELLPSGRGESCRRARIEIVDRCC